MPSVEECICYCEIARVVAKLEDSGAPCITEHEGFDAVCLNRRVLQTACILPIQTTIWKMVR